MAPSTTPEEADKNLQYIMLVLNTCEAFKPNYHEVARQDGICNANEAQKKFKKLVVQGGYTIVKGAVVLTDGKPATAVPANPMKTNGPKGKKRKGNGTSTSAKKRKVEEMSGDEDNENGSIKNEADVDDVDDS